MNKFQKGKGECLDKTYSLNDFNTIFCVEMRCIFSSNQNELVHLSCCFTEWIHCYLGILIYTYFSSVESDLIISRVSNCGSKILLLTNDETMNSRGITSDCVILRILPEVSSVSNTVQSCFSKGTGSANSK